MAHTFHSSELTRLQDFFPPVCNQNFINILGVSVYFDPFLHLSFYKLLNFDGSPNPSALLEIVLLFSPGFTNSRWSAFATIYDSPHK